MQNQLSSAPPKVGDQVEVFSLIAKQRGTIIAVHADGAIDVEHKVPGRSFNDEHGSFIQLGGAGPGEYVAMQCRARPEILADGTQRFLVMKPEEYRSNNEITRRDALLDDLLLTVKQCAKFPEDTEQTPLIGEFKRKLKNYLQHRENRPLPRSGELVCGTAIVRRGSEAKAVIFAGSVISSDQLGHVCVKLCSFESREVLEDEFESVARSYLEREIEIHAIDMEWKADLGRWSFEL